jgi:DsbC/DsbD-like thiol-disulfide interchange protein/cytochrome c biogenesis protein CcdA
MDFLLRALNGLLMTLLLASSSVAWAQAEKPTHLQPLLIAESAQPAPGSNVTLALVMRTEPGWHGYWENPGDAGLGMQIDWTLPPEVSLSPLRYPVPERLIVAGLMNHVFKRDHALLMTLQVPASARPGERLQLAGLGRWLACTDSICVPEQGRFSLNLTVGDGRANPAERSRFDSFRAAMPRPLGQPARWAQTGDRISIAIPYPANAPVMQPWFYTRTKDRIAYAAPQSARRVGDMLVIELQASADAPPGSGPLEGVLALGDGLALDLTATSGPVPAGGTMLGASSPAGGKISPAPTAGAVWSWAGFGLALGGALLGGLILNVMPCVFPILSLKALSLARAGGTDERGARREALAYTAGILLTCLALGGLMLALRAGGAQIGWAFQLQDLRIVALLLVLMVAITLNLAGLFELPAIGMGGEKAAVGGTTGAFWTGVLAAFVATPCAGPFMATAIGAALVLPPALALTVFAGLALGLAAPFLAIAYVPALRARLPKPGAWMASLRRILAIPMALTALALGWVLWRQAGGNLVAIGLALGLAAFAIAALWWIGRLQRDGKAITLPSLAVAGALGVAAFIGPALLPAPSADPARQAGDDQPFSEAALASHTAAGKPVFLYFTADWCLTCKVNEANALDRGEVRDAFRKAGVVVMVGDWTRADPAITRFLESKGRSGVPLYLYYPAGGGAPRELPQLLTPAMLASLPAGR